MRLTTLPALCVSLLTPSCHRRVVQPQGCCGIDEAAATSLLLRWYPEHAVPTERVFQVTEEPTDPRISYIAARVYPELGTKSQAELALKNGDLLHNGQCCTGSARVGPGDELTLTVRPLPRPPQQKLSSTARFVVHLLEQGLSVPFEDDHVAVVFKPPGIHTKRKSNPKFAALEDALPAVVCPSHDLLQDALPLPLAMHRLDVPVCGVVLVAKSRRAAIGIAKQLEERRVQKTYHALLVGRPDADGLLEAPVDDLPSTSRLRVLDEAPHAQWGSLCRVELNPLTGRTHQLRIHTAGIGCPIVGDELYWEMAAKARQESGAPPLPALKVKGGLFLQSCAVRFAHPVSGDELAVEVPEVAKFEKLLERARRGAEYAREG